MNIHHLQQQGLSLIGLLISITIGAFLLTAVLEVFNSTKIAYNAVSGDHTIRQESNFLLQNMNTVVSRAGEIRDPTTSSPFLRNIHAVFGTSYPFIDGTNGDGFNNSDSLIIRLEGNGGSPVTDCLGNTIPDQTARKITYDVISGNQLRCTVTQLDNTAIGNAIIADNVEKMKVLYGDDIYRTGSVNRYLPVDNTNLEKSSVISVKIAILMRSSKEIAAVSDNTTYNLIGNSHTISPADNYLRLVITNIIKLEKIPVQSRFCNPDSTRYAVSIYTATDQATCESNNFCYANSGTPNCYRNAF